MAAHRGQAIAALTAGKNVLCEKPLANMVEEARSMAKAARAAAERGVRSMVGFSYRRVPALSFASQLVRSGRIGEMRQAREAYLHDWLVDEKGHDLASRQEAGRRGLARRHRRARGRRRPAITGQAVEQVSVFSVNKENTDD